jgi:hypothetical protein
VGSTRAAWGQRGLDGDGWQSFVLYGRTLLVRQDGERWRLQLDGREASGVHLDHVVAELLDVPAQMGLSLALALLSAAPGSELA